MLRYGTRFRSSAGDDMDDVTRNLVWKFWRDFKMDTDAIAKAVGLAESEIEREIHRKPGDGKEKDNLQ